MPHIAAKATDAVAPEATEATTAAFHRIAGTPTHGYEPSREAAMAAFAELAAREGMIEMARMRITETGRRALANIQRCIIAGG